MTFLGLTSRTLDVQLFTISAQSSTVGSSVLGILLALSLPFLYLNVVSGYPQFNFPHASGYTFHPPFLPVPKPAPELYESPLGQGGGSSKIEMFYEDTYYVCETSSKSKGYLDPITSAIFRITPFLPYNNNCSSPFHPFLLMRNSGRTSQNLIGQTNKYTVLRGDTTDVVLHKNDIITIPSNYFCSLRNVTNLEIHGNIIDSSGSFGFSKQCGANCSVTLRTLQLPENRMINLVANSFCGFPNLKELELSKNLIDSVDEDAFLTLDNLLKLSLVKNKLRSLPKNVFQPLKKLLTLDLSVNLLSETIFDRLELLATLRVLRLSSNNIIALPRGSIIGLESLSELYLDDNDIVSLSSSFSNLPNLQLLVLNSNKISEVLNDTFDALVNLTVLKLAFNDIHQLSYAHFLANEKLEQLDIMKNNFSSVPDLTLVSSLKKLVLNENKIMKITSEDGRIICDMHNLEELHLEMNSLENIAEGAFDCNLSLVIVNLNNNKLRSIRRTFPNAEIKKLILAQNKIEELWLDDIALDVVEVNLDGNKITSLKSPFNQRIRNMSLVRLNLANNLLEDLSDVHLPPSLEYLFLDHNQIHVFDLGNYGLPTNDTSCVLENLQMISLTFNQIEAICPFILYLIASETLPVLNLKGNPLSCSCEISFLRKYEDRIKPNYYSLDLPDSGTCPDWQRSPNNKHLPASVNADRFSCNAVNSNPFCECHFNNFYSSVCNFPCPERCLCYLSSEYNFQLINCTGGGFNNLPLLASPLPLELYFTNNSLRSVNGTMLHSYAKAEVLYLNNNQIDRIEAGAFKRVLQLRVLNLEFNLLKSLPDGAFDNLFELKELYLAHNRLMHLTMQVFQPLGAIRVLQLHDNNLRNFSVWNLYDSSTLARLSLRDNPWSCDCHYIEQFRNWLQNYSFIVEDVSTVFCTADNGTVQNSPLISFNSSQCYVLKDEIFVSNIALWASVLASLVLVSLLCVMTFIYRQEMQVLIYYNYGLRLFHKNTEELDTDKIYDAFVAHSALDEEFLANELIPGLEQIEQPYRLCIHQRDFMVGAVISDSILEAVEKSRRTIVLLSENFVRSEWCRFEFKSAHLKALTDRCKRLIVIVLGKLPSDLDPEMKLYLKTNTYLEWSDRLFWEKLYFALPDNRLPEM